MNNIELLHQVDLDIVKEVVKICDEHGLTYYMLGGTMLGAIRHKGFIPWDDDIDLGIPREDYEVFLKVAPQHLPKRMRLENFRINPNYLYYSSRILDTETVVKEERMGLSNAGIDIFPIDGTPNNDIFRKIYYFRVFFHKSLMSMCNKTHIDRKRNRSKSERLILYILEHLPIEKMTTAYKQKCIIDKLLSKQKVQGSKYIGNIMGAYRTREIVPAEYYGKGEMYQFEDIELRGMAMAEEYLKYTYGDYMQLPPEDKRKCHFEIIEIHGICGKDCGGI